MTSGSMRLITAGFKNKDAWKAFEEKTKEEGKKVEEQLKDMDSAGAEKLADHDELEYTKDQMMVMDYPKPVHKYYLIYETPNESLEPMYYGMLQSLFDMGFPKVLKITDIFTGSEHSSFWGSGASRLGIQQDKAMTFLASLGKMVKDLFQIVREIRWLDERIKYYVDAKKDREAGEPKSAAEMTLKGLWVDMVDGVAPGGQKTGANILTMAAQLQFTTLPDFFFAVNPKKDEDINGMVDKLEINNKVKEVLKRKLYAYTRWREETSKEMSARRGFNIKYLRQHFLVIKMYMNWAKPYLKHVERLSGSMEHLDSPEIVSAFESALLEVEILALQMPKGNKSVYSCLLVTFEYRTKPNMQFQVEYSHRGPIHVGEVRLAIRAYAWTWDQIKAYRQMKNREDLELLAGIDGQIKGAMEFLKDDLDRYLAEAEGKDAKKEEKKEEKAPPGFFEPFTAVYKGFEDMAKMFVPSLGTSSKPPADPKKEMEELETAQKGAKSAAWNCYKGFKKSKGMVTW